MEGMAFRQHLQHVQMCRSTKDALHLSFNFIERLGAFYKMAIERWAEINLRRPYNAHRASSANCAALQVGWHWEPFKDFGADARMSNARLIWRQCNIKHQYRRCIRTTQQGLWSHTTHFTHTEMHFVITFRWLNDTPVEKELDRECWNKRTLELTRHRKKQKRKSKLGISNLISTYP